MSTITDSEQSDIDRLNASGKQPVVFVHGLWLLPGSWQAWRDFYEQRGFAAMAPSWPDDPATLAEAREHPELFAGKGVGQIADHLAEVVGKLDRKPILIGHSFGGLLVQKLAGLGLAAATVAIDPAPFKGVTPLPLSTLKASSPVLTKPANRNKAVTLTFDQFRYGFASNTSEQEAQELYESFHVAAPGKPLFQAAFANFRRTSETSVDTKTAARGPLLVISGQVDHIVPFAVANAAYKIQRKNTSAVTEFAEISGRGHSLTIDSGWQEVAQTALDFVSRFAPAEGVSASA